MRPTFDDILFISNFFICNYERALLPVTMEKDDFALKKKNKLIMQLKKIKNVQFAFRIKLSITCI